MKRVLVLLLVGRCLVEAVESNPTNSKDLVRAKVVRSFKPRTDPVRPLRTVVQVREPTEEELEDIRLLSR